MNDNQELWYEAEYNSTAIMLVCGALVIFCLLRAFISENFLLFWSMGLACFIFMILFFSVRIECDEEEVRIIYGIGLIKAAFPIFGIATAGPIKNEKLSTLPYNPRGRGAVAIELRDGKKYFIPADSCKQLAQALLVRLIEERNSAIERAITINPGTGHDVIPKAFLGLGIWRTGNPATAWTGNPELREQDLLAIRLVGPSRQVLVERNCTPGYNCFLWDALELSDLTPNGLYSFEIDTTENEYVHRFQIQTQ